MLFPIGDENRKVTTPAYVTWGLIAVNLLVFFLLQGAGQNEGFTYGFSVVPREITEGVDLTQTEIISVEGRRIEIPQAPGPSPIYLTILTAMFMHGGFMHLFGNLLYLWIFGDNVEHRFGHLVFLSFYLISGLVATLAQVFIDPEGVIPNLGASGAISGVLGGYLVLFPRNRVHVIFFWLIVSVPAIVAIGVWIVFQFINGYGAIMVAQETAGGVAYGAHIGGFAAGVVMALVLRFLIKEKPDHVFRRVPDRSTSRRYW